MNDRPDDTRSTLSEWLPFSIAAVVLAGAALGWGVALKTLKWYTRKEPVAWPAAVKVDGDTFKNITLPEKFGPFRMVTEDGVIPGRKPDGEPDGDLTYNDEDLETLRIGTMLDQRRWDERKSNWYVTRIYEDTREKPASPYRFWQLDVVYYTGGELTVPHVPDECVQAAGATPTGRDILPIDMHGLDDEWASWRKGTELVALRYQKTQGGVPRNFVQYYLFCMCGQARTSREKVRMELMELKRRYVYFSKVQFFPMGASTAKPAESDRRAMDFLGRCLPGILHQLPSEEMILALGKDQ